MSFATRYRRLNQEDEIMVLDKGPYVSFANCGLPYYLSNEITDKEQLLVAKETMLKNRFNLDIRVNHEVVGINPESKTVEVKTATGNIKLDYDKLILSPGAKPVIPPIKDLDKIAHFVLRNIPDLDNIMTFIDQYHPKKMIVVGAGFIGLEVAEALTKKQVAVTIVEASRHILPPLDAEMAAFGKKALTDHGVTVYDHVTVESADKNGLYVSNGLFIPADGIVLATGVSPDVAFLKGSGIKLGLRGGILIDDS